MSAGRLRCLVCGGVVVWKLKGRLVEVVTYRDPEGGRGGGRSRSVEVVVVEYGKT